MCQAYDKSLMYVEVDVEGGVEYIFTSYASGSILERKGKVKVWCQKKKKVEEIKEGYKKRIETHLITFI